ncbi:hypothetical protein VR45_06920 [Streptomyces sp. NRRL S-495]|nr:hypothetical protein VR45_06920 [Streptomyces sp. NRRL S-495]
MCGAATVPPATTVRGWCSRPSGGRASSCRGWPTTSTRRPLRSRRTGCAGATCCSGRTAAGPRGSTMWGSTWAAGSSSRRPGRGRPSGCRRSATASGRPTSAAPLSTACGRRGPPGRGAGVRRRRRPAARSARG